MRPTSAFRGHAAQQPLMKDALLHSSTIVLHTDLHSAGPVRQAASNMSSGSKWKVVADKVGESEGKGGLAALLLSMNKGNTRPLPVTLPAIVGPASSSSSSLK